MKRAVSCNGWHGPRSATRREPCNRSASASQFRCWKGMLACCAACALGPARAQNHSSSDVVEDWVSEEAWVF